MKADDLLGHALKIMQRASDSLEEFHATIEQIEDDEILSSPVIGEGMEKNLLQTKREIVRHLEDARTKAWAKKQVCDAAYAAKLAALELAKPKMLEGVIEQFTVGGPRTMEGLVHNDHGELQPQSKTMMVPEGGRFIQVPRAGNALAEKQSARLAHDAFCQANGELIAARMDLSRLEDELRQLKAKFECLDDL